MQKLLAYRRHVLTVATSCAAVGFLFAMASWASMPHDVAVHAGSKEDNPAILVPLITATSAPEILPPVRTPATPIPREYVEVIEGCGPYFEGPCVNVRGGAGEGYAVVQKLRMGAVVEVDRAVYADGRTWYHITHRDWLRFPERAGNNWYIASDYVRHFVDDSAVEIPVGSPAQGNKSLIVDRSDQKMYAYDGDILYRTLDISTGLRVTPTPRGIFTIYKKTPSRYMQGPIAGISDQYYDLPGVPWNLYFTAEGAVVHGAYWHDKFGQPWSHGCVNLPPAEAQDIYQWADVGTQITVRD
ncbi:MAG: L,D-transpeptidase family protein [Candidatus Pacebacteria bacterium]|nr:L,D-transpeptidase family protein [Candidatus Paceibacterota bacterium]